MGQNHHHQTNFGLEIVGAPLRKPERKGFWHSAIWKLATRGPKPYEFTGNRMIHGLKPYEFIREIVINYPKPNEFI